MKYCKYISREFVCEKNGLICPFEDPVHCPEVCEDELIDSYDQEAADDAKYHSKKEG